jgi:hypothetical protein
MILMHFLIYLFIFSLFHIISYLFILYHINHFLLSFYFLFLKKITSKYGERDGQTECLLSTPLCCKSYILQ